MEGQEKQQQCSFKVMCCYLMTLGQEKAMRAPDQLFTMYLEKGVVHLKLEEQIYTLN
jgi:hypothetical protein